MSRAQRKTGVSLIVAALLVGAAAVGTSSGFFADVFATTSHTVSPSAFKDALAAPGVQLIDLRTPQEFASGHIAGATNIDFYAPDFQSRIAALDRNASYAIYCHTGNRSAQTLALMQRLQFTHITNLQGGIAAWGQAAYPTTIN